MATTQEQIGVDENNVAFLWGVFRLCPWGWLAKKDQQSRVVRAAAGRCHRAQTTGLVLLVLLLLCVHLWFAVGRAWRAMRLPVL